MFTIKKLAKSEIEVTGQIPAEELEKFFVKAVKEAKENLNLPGFRKGTAPEKMVMGKIGEHALLESAAERALQEEWPKIIREEKLELIGRPEVSITKLARGNPMEFKITAATIPEMALPDYIEAAKEIFSREVQVSVSDEEIKQTLDYLKKGQAEDKSATGAENQKDFGSEEMKESVRKNISFEKETKAKEEKRIEFLEKITEGVKIELPPALLEYEIEKMVRELKASLAGMGLEWEAYLKHVKKTEEKLKKEWDAEAKKRVKFGLTLRKIAREQNIFPAADVLNAKSEEVFRGLSEEEKKKTSRENIREYLFGRIQHEMIFDFLEKNK
ncbi:hypothetical protein HYT01_03600 [Candidatus Giovannonibacteria bacterium]|nr:hypothetical protein [Candidatus Giovannonibacteria bacterium]